MSHEDNIHKAQRNKNLVSSLITAVIARFSGIFLQVISIPIAAISLGNEGFALYAMLVGIMSWLTLSKIGIGPAMTVSISEKRITDNQIQKIISSTGFYVVMGLITFVSIISILSVNTPYVYDYLFKNYLGLESEINRSLMLVLTMFILYSLFSVIESIQLAYQQQYYFNLFSTVGTAISGLLVILVARYSPSVFNILLAANAPQLLVRAANVVLFCIKNQVAIPVLGLFDFSLSRKLFKDGVRYFLSGPVNNFIFNVLPIIYVSANWLPHSAASFAAIMNAVVLLSSLFALINGPMLAAVAEAKARGDLRWIKVVYKKLILATIMFSLVINMILLYCGENIFDVWYSGTIAVASLSLIFAGLYYSMNGIEVLNYTLLSGVGKIKIVSLVMLLKCCVFLFGISLIQVGDELYYIFACMSFVAFLFSVVPLTNMTIKLLWGESN